MASRTFSFKGLIGATRAVSSSQFGPRVPVICKRFASEHRTTSLNARQKVYQEDYEFYLPGDENYKYEGKIPEEYEISFTDPNNIIFDWDPDTSLLKAFTCIAGFLSTLLGVWGIFYLFDIKSYKPSLDRKPFPEWYVYYGGDPAKAPKRIEDLK